MKVSLEKTTYTIIDETIQSARDHIRLFATSQYAKLPEVGRIAAMAGTRALLAYAEKQETDPAKKQHIRPPKGVDPTLYLVELLLSYITEALPHVKLFIHTEGDTITGIGIENSGEGGRPLPFDGNVGVGQDDSSKAARPESSQAVSIPSSLHSG